MQEIVDNNGIIKNGKGKTNTENTSKGQKKKKRGLEQMHHKPRTLSHRH